MSGHSKWATIKHQKETKDKQRGQVFSKLSRAISVAVIEGGGETDPNANFRLRLAIEQARGADMPKSNIERAISRAGGKKDGSFSSLQFEGYGPEGVAVIVNAVTDNRQRTTQELKNIFEKSGGSLASPGAVSYNFRQVGEIFLAPKKEEKTEEQVLFLMDFPGVEDVEEEEGKIRLTVAKESLARTVADLEEKGFSVFSSSLVFLPQVPLMISDPQKREKVTEFLSRLEEHDDVQSVFSNF
ncbi:YebC/PmpR family DNA-binding transcriptional regulator [Candidatus Shapirobacteria bacterium]|nr:YebC/PmpR family DNA-binding transcriptional regulator [Candidatus Shapirobacteria bacterium]